MTSSAVVVNGDNCVVAALGDSPYSIIDALLHLRVGALHCIKLYSIIVLTCIYGAYCAASHSNTIIVSAKNNHLVAHARTLLKSVILLGIAHTAGKHNNLVVAKHRGLICLCALAAESLIVLKGVEAAADNALAKLVAKIAGAIAGLGKNLLRSLVEPFARSILLPFALNIKGITASRILKYCSLLLYCASLIVASRFYSRIEPWVGGHIDRCAGYRETPLSACHSVPYLSACSCSGAIERLHCCREVVCLRLKAYYSLGIFCYKEIRFGTACRMEHLYGWALQEGAVVFVCANYKVWILLACPLYHLKERTLHLLAIYHKDTIKDLVPAVLAVYL